MVVGSVMVGGWLRFLLFLLLGLEVEDGSHGGTGVVSHLSHLLLEVILLRSWELLESLGKGGELSNDDKHILGEVLNQL